MSGVPGKVDGVWEIKDLRRYGVIENRFCFEGGTNCGKNEGLFVFLTDRGKEITEALKLSSIGKLFSNRKFFGRRLFGGGKFE